MIVNEKEYKDTCKKVKMLETQKKPLTSSQDRSLVNYLFQIDYYKKTWGKK